MCLLVCVCVCAENGCARGPQRLRSSFQHVCECVFVCVRVHVYMRASVHVYLFVRVCVFACVLMCMFVCVATEWGKFFGF